MKKLCIIITCICALMLGASAFVDNRREVAIGNDVPTLVLGEGDEAFSLESLKGKWVILSFWSAADAESRLGRNQIEAFFRGPGADAATDVEVVSVNFDRSSQLMNEIIKHDNLLGEHHHVASSETMDALRSAFRMENGLRSFVINPEGKLVAADPTPKDLSRIFS